MNISSQEYFKRQTTLTEIGLEGQELLQKAKILVIGCGGLGSLAAVYLATSGVGNLHLVDFDTISISNLHRQVFYKVTDVDKQKAEKLANVIKEKAPFTKVSFSNKAVDKNSILELISNFDIIVDGTDNLQVKYLINDACVLAKKPLVYGSLYKFDGYVATFNVLDEANNYTCNLRDAFPKIATDIPNCEEAGILNPIVGIIALLQVNEVIKLITKIGKPLLNQLLIYNALNNSQLKIKLKKNKSLIIENIFQKSTYLDEQFKIQNPSLLISNEELKSKLKDKNITIISVVNDVNLKLPFKVDDKVPSQTFNVENFKPNYKKKYVIVCKKGITSYNVTLKLKTKYPLLAVCSIFKGIENY